VGKFSYYSFKQKLIVVSNLSVVKGLVLVANVMVNVVPSPLVLFTETEYLSL